MFFQEFICDPHKIRHAHIITNYIKDVEEATCFTTCRGGNSPRGSPVYLSPPWCSHI